MITYQDYLDVPNRDRDQAEFVRNIIKEYQNSTTYRTALIADDYERNENTTIKNYDKVVTDAVGKLIKDIWSPNHKMASNFFSKFTTQLNQYLLGNGITWKNPATAKKLGYKFDGQVQKAGKEALNGGVSYGFWNLDHLDVFNAREFCTLQDEETGGYAAGVRFWRIAPEKPLRAVFYDQDGYTSYLWADKEIRLSDAWQKLDNGLYMRAKTAYIRQEIGDLKDRLDGTTQIIDEPVGGFPIVPLWGNPHHQSEIVGLREKIDAYDLIMNGFENDLDNAQILWVLKGASGLGGQDEVELVKFFNQLRRLKGVSLGEDQDVVPVPIQIPYEARERLLDRLKKQLYEDAMIMNPEDIAGGAATATQIRAAYEPQNTKTDEYEYCVLDFLSGIMQLAGVEDEPTFTRSMIVNVQEEVQTVLSAAPYLSSDYVTRKILTIMGDGDKADEMIQELSANEINQLNG